MTTIRMLVQIGLAELSILTKIVIISGLIGNGHLVNMMAYAYICHQNDFTINISFNVEHNINFKEQLLHIETDSYM